MKANVSGFLTKFYIYTAITLLGCCLTSNAQESDFWNRVRFGGSLGLAFGSGYTDITIAPGALYEINEYVGVGLGLQGTYVNQKHYYSSFIYGASAITVFNPIPQVQLSAEIEQLRVNLDVDDGFADYTSNFWNTALFLGAGYRMENVTIGLRYNVLFRENDFVYSDALMPFIRVYF